MNNTTKNTQDIKKTETIAVEDMSKEELVQLFYKLADEGCFDDEDIDDCDGCHCCDVDDDIGDIVDPVIGLDKSIWISIPARPFREYVLNLMQKNLTKALSR